MNKDLTEIIFLLDRSGSMSGLEKDTIGGFNGFIEEQKKLQGGTIVTAALFDNQYELIYNGEKATDVKLTKQTYFVRGTTALLDAIGKTIIDVGHRYSKMTEDQRPGKVIFVITTDGLENASKEFTLKKVRELITHQREKYNWEFIFLGANMDAVSEARNMGLRDRDAFNYQATQQGTQNIYSKVNREVTSRRGFDWKEDKKKS